MVIILKYLWLIIILLLGSCQKPDILVIKPTLYPCYGLNEKTRVLELIYVEYEIIDEQDIFKLFTNKQNHLPLGYISYGNGNIGLVSSEVIDNEIYYYVDRYIYLSDYDKFYNQMLMTAKLYNFTNIYIYLNGKKL